MNFVGMRVLDGPLHHQTVRQSRRLRLLRRCCPRRCIRRQQEAGAEKYGNVRAAEISLMDARRNAEMVGIRVTGARAVEVVRISATEVNQAEVVWISAMEVNQAE